MEMIPVKEFSFGDDLSKMHLLTCMNHRTARYISKNPYVRGLHVIQLPEGDILRSRTGECLCPFSDLAVIVEK